MGIVKIYHVCSLFPCHNYICTLYVVAAIELWQIKRKRKLGFLWLRTIIFVFVSICWRWQGGSCFSIIFLFAVLQFMHNFFWVGYDCFRLAMPTPLLYLAICSLFEFPFVLGDLIQFFIQDIAPSFEATLQCLKA